MYANKTLLELKSIGKNLGITNTRTYGKHNRMELESRIHNLEGKEIVDLQELQNTIQQLQKEFSMLNILVKTHILKSKNRPNALESIIVDTFMDPDMYTKLPVGLP